MGIRSLHPVKAVDKNIEKGLIRMKAFSVLILTLYTVRAANIVEVLQKHGATKLVDLAVKAGLAETLTGDGPLAVFAPTNDAISALPSSLVQLLMDDTELLKKVLLYHVVAGEITSNMADNNVKLDSVEGSPLLVNLYLKSKYYDGFITINGKRVVSADNMADMVLFILLMVSCWYPKETLLTHW